MYDKNCKTCGKEAVVFVDPDFIGDGHGDYYCREHGIKEILDASDWLISDRNQRGAIPSLYFWWEGQSLKIVIGKENDSQP